MASLAFLTSYGCLLPVFPLWSERYVGSLTKVGIVTTLAAGIGLVAGRPVAARMMEGRNRVPTLVLGAVLSGMAAVGFPAFPGVMPMFALRMLQGLGFGLMSTAAISTVTDLAPPARRGEMLGYFGALNALSLIVGPLIGAMLARSYGYSAAFYAAAVLSGLTIVAVVGIDEPPKPSDVSGRLFEVLRVPLLKSIIGVHLLTILMHGALLAFLPHRLKEHAGWMSVEAFFAIDAVVLIVFRLVVGKRFDVIPRAYFVRLGLVCMILAGVALGVDAGDGILVMAAVLYGLGFGAYIPSINATVGDLVPETHRARGFAVFMLAFDLALAFGGLIVGPVADVSLLWAFWCAALGPALALALHVFGIQLGIQLGIQFGTKEVDHGSNEPVRRL